MPHAYDNMTEPELENHFNTLARDIKKRLPPNTGFLLLAAPFGTGTAQYVSNVERKDSIDWMKETIKRWESGDFVPRVGA